MSFPLFGFSFASKFKETIKKSVQKEDLWTKEGFYKEREGYWKRISVSDPKEAKKWLNMFGYSPNEDVFKLNNTIFPKILNWKDRGFTADEAIEWSKLDMGSKWAQKQKEQGITIEQARIKLSKDALKDYFSVRKGVVPKYSKDDITFAGIGMGLDYRSAIDEICKISFITKIDNVNKDEFCSKKETLPHIKKIDTEAYNFSKKMYFSGVAGYIKVKEHKVYIKTNYLEDIVADAITLKGVKFKIYFLMRSVENPKVLVGMYYDGTVPMLYYTRKTGNRLLRYLSYTYLTSIELEPIDSKLYKNQYEILVKMFKEKYPNLKMRKRSYKATLPSYETDQFYINEFAIYYSFGDKFIDFDKYIELYNKRKREKANKLAEKNDDSSKI